MKQSRAFFFALIAIVVVWIVSNMSEQQDYREHFDVSYEGIDTARYAVTRSDKGLTLDVTSNGFNAFRRSIGPGRTVRLSVPDKFRGTDSSFRIVIDPEEQLESICSQLDMRGVKRVQTVGNPLELRAERRCRKGFVPSIDRVDFHFDGMTGLSGEPVIKPDTVWLYGSASSLAHISRIEASPATLRHITRSGSHRLPLEPVWKQYEDLRVSTTHIELYLPVERFTERDVEVPVAFLPVDEVQQVNLYPSKVTVTYLVPEKEFNKVTAAQFRVNAVATGDSGSMLRPVVSQFPSNVRIKSISPDQIQYIVIK